MNPTQAAISRNLGFATRLLTLKWTGTTPCQMLDLRLISPMPTSGRICFRSVVGGEGPLFLFPLRQGPPPRLDFFSYWQANCAHPGILALVIGNHS